jgi:hypothetical protein
MVGKLFIVSALLLSSPVYGQEEAAVPGVGNAILAVENVAPDDGMVLPEPPVLTDGASVEATGCPVKPDFHEFQGTGILWFSVATDDGTVKCYAEGTNTWVLRDIQNRLARVVAWNSDRLLEGNSPVAVAVRGTYDARRDAIHVSGLDVPRGSGNRLTQPLVWDAIDPDRGDGTVAAGYYDSPGSGYYTEYGSIPAYEYPVGSYAGSPPVVVNNYYYNYSIYEEAYDYPRYRTRYSSSYPYYGGYYPIYTYPSYPHRPHHPIHRPDRPDHRPDYGYKRSSGTPSLHAGFYFQPTAPTTGRAERWGQAMAPISRKFTHPYLSQSVKPYLNPSQLPEYQQEYGRGGNSGDYRHRGGDSRHGSGGSFHGVTDRSSGRHSGFRGR